MFACGGDLFAQCKAPRYRKGQDYGASVWISIAPRDFTLEKLICLGQTLRNKRLRDPGQFGVFFFTSFEAAKYFQPPVEGVPPKWRVWARNLHAIYSYEKNDKDKNKSKETIDIIPLGYGEGPSIGTTLNLSLINQQHCGLQIEERCLMLVMQSIDYPEEALKAKVSGKVTLTGIISLDGRVGNLQVAEADVSPSEAKDVLATASFVNLESWRFDSGKAETPIRITFTYAIDASSPAGLNDDVNWELPNQIVIRGNPRN
jgi:hypothetical protein